MADILKEVVIPVATGGLLTLIVTRHYERTNEKRIVFAKSYETVLAWQEMLYRVRRREDGQEAERKLVNRFHDLQELLNYNQGILSAESKSLGKSYKRFVTKVKKENVDLIQEAWQQKTRKPYHGTPSNEKHPDINGIANEYLKDIRQWLVWWQLPKLAVWWRYRNVK